MKKNLLIILSLTLIIGFYSCSDDFKVAAPYKNITWVYGLLNSKDTAHYIVIKKAFLDENKNAVDMAKVADSSYYPSLDVIVREIANGVVVKNITLEKVDLTNEGYPKDTGVFYNAPNYAYKFKNYLDSTRTYRLVINNDALNIHDSSEIRVLAASQLTTQNFQNKLDFAGTKNEAATTIFWKVPDNTAYVESKIRFRWVDRNISTGEQTNHEADYTMSTTYTFPLSSNILTMKASNAALYTFLNGTMGSPGPNIERYIDSCDLFFAAGATELYNYYRVQSIQSSGLNADQIKPIFTNIKGDDVYGIYSSRANIIYKNVPITENTLDSLMINPITEHLNIVGRSDH